MTLQKTTLRVDKGLWLKIKVAAITLGYRSANAFIIANMERLIDYLKENDKFVAENLVKVEKSTQTLRR